MTDKKESTIKHVHTESQQVAESPPLASVAIMKIKMNILFKM